MYDGKLLWYTSPPLTQDCVIKVVGDEATITTDTATYKVTLTNSNIRVLDDYFSFLLDVLHNTLVKGVVKFRVKRLYL